VNQLLDVNLTKGTTRVFNGAGKRLGSRGIAYRNGMLYYCNPNVYYNLSYRSLFQRYNVATGETNLIAPLTQYGGYLMEWGDDGWLYIGSYGMQGSWGTGGADLARYHPDTGTLEDLGKVDPEHAAEYNSQYAYSLHADTNFCYVALGLLPWYLAVINTQTGDKTSFFAGTDTLGEIRRDADRLLWYRRSDSNRVTTYYLLSNGIPVLTGYKAPPGLIDQQLRGGVVDNAPAHTNLTGFNFDLDLIYPDSSNNVATVGYATNGSGIWNVVTASNFNLTAATIRRLYADGTNLFIPVTFTYGPWLRYHPATSNVLRYGTAPYSMYDAVKRGNKWYVSGYTAATLEFDSARPWTLTKANIHDPSANPRKLPDGLLYVAAYLERGGVGGEIGWYNPSDESYGSLRDPLAVSHHNPADFKPILGGSKFVYSTTGSILFVFDTATKTLLSTNAPLDTKSPGKVVEVANGVILGLSGTNMYRWDCSTGSLVWSNNLNGTAFGSSIATVDRRVELGPDGYVWAFIGTVLNRINPADGSMTPIYTNNASQNVMFHGRDMYLYGGTKLYRVRGVLTLAGPAPPSGVHLVAQKK
jgi:hypothetical protein